MNDVIQWVLDTNTYDIGRLVVGLLILTLIVEFIASFREWIKS